MVVCAAGCQPSANPRGQAMPGAEVAPATSAPSTTHKPSAASARWPYWPAKMRVHPLTRLVMQQPNNQWLVETRIEFVDSDGARCSLSG